MSPEPVRVVAIIPARMASSRLPGKPLLEIHGLLMVEHVRRRALLCRRFAEVVVATCDQAIARAIEGFGGRVIMTAPNHPAATDRVAEAMQHLDCTHVVNVQGDEMLVLPSDLARFVAAAALTPEVPAWNAVACLEEAGESSDPSIVKCAVSGSGRVLFCSRDFSWLNVNAGTRFAPLRRIVGILGYRRDFLARYGQLTRTPLERAEAIDQSRILEHDVELRTVEFARGYPGINEPREVALVTRILEEDPAQQAIVQELLERWPVPSST